MVEWLSSNRSALVNWSASQTGVVYHQVELESPSPFTDVDGQAEDGVFYHAMLAVRRNRRRLLSA